MLLFKNKPMLPGRTLDHVKEDYQSADKIGPCRVSGAAFYGPDGSYLLLQDITDAVSGMGSAHVTGCCAGSVPVPRVVITAGGKKFPILCSNAESAARLAQKLKMHAE